MASLKVALQKEMYSAVQETVETSYEDLKENVRHFYDAPPSERYLRTKQLMNAPQIKSMNFNGDSATGEIEIDTNTPHYDPAGRTVQEIYGYAEADGLLGNGGFWQRTESQIEDNIQKCFGKHFSK